MHAGSQVLGSWIGVLAAERRRHKNHVDQLINVDPAETRTPF